jgi:molybdopterin molybdotransferase
MQLITSNKKLMIEFEEAFRIVMESGFETESETISFLDSYSRILDEDIASDIDMPPFNRSAMDGYACHRTDLSSDLEIVEVISAGKEPAKMVGKNQCSKVMTGAIVPDGCDIVIMNEETTNLITGKIRFTGNDPKFNISLKGEDIKAGEIVLRKGKFIQPQEIAVMASVGKTKIMVKRRPKVGIISTGDELVEPSVQPDISQIRNSNAYQLVTQVARSGGEGTNYGIAPDNEAITLKMIEHAINESDIVIITGGVSMGDFDFVPLVMEQAGIKILFDQVNVQPGKPTTFGIHPKAIVFGLPGNPVSSFIQFELLIRPLISSMMGHHWIPVECKLSMAVDYNRKSSVRLGFIPVTINKNKEVIPVSFHGSAHIMALTYSDGIIAMKPGTNSLEKGEIVNVRQI